MSSDPLPLWRPPDIEPWDTFNEGHPPGRDDLLTRKLTPRLVFQFINFDDGSRCSWNSGAHAGAFRSLLCSMAYARGWDPCPEDTNLIGLLERVVQIPGIDLPAILTAYYFIFTTTGGRS